MSFEFFLVLKRQVGQTDEPTATADEIEVGAAGWKDNITQRRNAAAEKIIEISLGHRHAK